MGAERKLNYRTLGLKRIFPEPDDSTIGNPGRDFSPRVFNDSDFTYRDRLEMRFLRATLTQIFGVKNLGQIYESVRGEEGKTKEAAAYNKFVTEYPNLYGYSDYTIREKELLISISMAKANEAIRYMDDSESGILRNLKTTLGHINEIEARNNPIKLLLTMFNPESSKRARYEARRKLVLMDLALKSFGELEEKSVQMDSLLTFLDEIFWEGGIAETDTVEYYTDHSVENYACTNVHILQQDEKFSVSDYRRYNRLKMRKWTRPNGKSATVYFEDRLKDPVGLIFKMMRKDIKDPQKIDDYLGLKFVFPTKNDIYDFLESLQKKSAAAGTMIFFEEPSDTIDNSDKFNVVNQGSSENFEAVKVNATLNGIKVELIFHTFRTYADSRFHDERGLEQYSIKRLFDSGIMDLFYPFDIYEEEVSKHRDAILHDRRHSVRSTSNIDIPQNRKKENQQLIRYTTDDFITDMTKIIEQLESRPEIIIAVGHSGSFMASLLSKMLGGIPVVEFKKENDKLSLPKLKGKKVLIVNGLSKDARKIIKLKGLLPDATVAAIGIRDNSPEEIKSLINIYARKIPPNTWLRYNWELPDIEIALSQGIILFYKIENGQVLFLAEETKRNNSKGQQLKLIGGKHDKIDYDLLATSLRELREETGKRMSRKVFIPLSNLSFNFEKSENDKSDYLKGFIQAFALKVKDGFKLKNREEGIGNFIWVTASEFIPKSLWLSYVKGIGTWIKEIENIEGLNKPETA